MSLSTTTKKKTIIEQASTKIRQNNSQMESILKNIRERITPSTSTSPINSPRDAKASMNSPRVDFLVNEKRLSLEDVISMERLSFEKHNSFSPKVILETMQKELVLPRRYSEFDVRTIRKMSVRNVIFKPDDLMYISQKILCKTEDKIEPPVPRFNKYFSTREETDDTFDGNNSPRFPTHTPLHTPLPLTGFEERLMIARRISTMRTPTPLGSPRETNEN
jgi:hypothetical protein